MHGEQLSARCTYFGYTIGLVVRNGRTHTTPVVLLRIQTMGGSHRQHKPVRCTALLCRVNQDAWQSIILTCVDINKNNCRVYTGERRAQIYNFSLYYCTVPPHPLPSPLIMFSFTSRTRLVGNIIHHDRGGRPPVIHRRQAAVSLLPGRIPDLELYRRVIELHLLRQERGCSDGGSRGRGQWGYDFPESLRRFYGFKPGHLVVALPCVVQYMKSVL